MGNDQRNYLIVGAFVIAMVAALAIWISLLTGRTGATDRYHIHFANVMGLAEGSEVLFEGYPVGLIESISAAGDDEDRRFRVDVAVRRGWPIPADSVARITAGGLLSAVVIDIRAGNDPTVLPAGGEIAGQEASNLLAAMSAAAGDVDGLIRDLQPLIDSLSEGVPVIVDNLANATGDLRGTRERLDEALDRVNALLQQNRDGLEQSVDDLRHTLAAVARHIDAVSRNLDETTRNLAEFSYQIRRDPSLLLRGRSTDDGGEEAR